MFLMGHAPSLEPPPSPYPPPTTIPTYENQPHHEKVLAIAFKMRCHMPFYIFPFFPFSGFSGQSGNGNPDFWVPLESLGQARSAGTL